jgi:hypothetical protein
MGGSEVPLGTSGSNRPDGMRSWMCRIAAVSVLGIEIASASPAAVLNSTTNLWAEDHDPVLAGSRLQPGL